MREASPDTSRAWINIFVAIYFILLLVAPALWFFGCLYLWVVPMRPRERHHLVYLTRFGWAPSPLEVAGRVRDTSATRPRHVLQAYSTPEVFILTIGTALVPLGPVLKQMLMDKRDTIDAAIYQYAISAEMCELEHKDPTHGEGRSRPCCSAPRRAARHKTRGRRR